MINHKPQLLPENLTLIYPMPWTRGLAAAKPQGAKAHGDRLPATSDCKRCLHIKTSLTCQGFSQIF